ncbi:MAG: hypothetical protein OXH70_17680 [Acidobacteria bacterium]|nr:hypothetical protein [Acidobacteriota bacterium]
MIEVRPTGDADWPWELRNDLPDTSRGTPFNSRRAAEAAALLLMQRHLEAMADAALGIVRTWSARPHTELDATADKWLFGLDDAEASRRREREERRAEIRRAREEAQARQQGLWRAPCGTSREGGVWTTGTPSAILLSR